MLKMDVRKDILNIRFNEDQTCFTVAMEDGCRVYQVEPMQLIAHYPSEKVGSIGVCEMRFRSSVLAMVSGGICPKFASNTALIWNDQAKSFTHDYTCRTRIINCLLRMDKIALIQQRSIDVYSFPPPLTDRPGIAAYQDMTFRTGDNPKGLCDVTIHASYSRQLMVFPFTKRGSIQIVSLKPNEEAASKSPVIISAHTHDIAYIVLNQAATMVATASVTGTLIRVFCTAKKIILYEFRRGSDEARIYCITFSTNAEYLCCSSDKGTVHIFELKESEEDKWRMGVSATLPVLSTQYFLARFVKKNDFASFRVNPDCPCICAFGPDRKVYAVCADGTFHKYSLASHRPPSNCNKEDYYRYLENCFHDF